jgi:hypothetical protein
MQSETYETCDDGCDHGGCPWRALGKADVKLIAPVGGACSFEECPAGPFVPLAYPDSLCFKSEYGMEGNSKRDMAFNAAGEFYHGEGLVQPVELIIERE